MLKLKAADVREAEKILFGRGGLIDDSSFDDIEKSLTKLEELRGGDTSYFTLILNEGEREGEGRTVSMTGLTPEDAETISGILKRRLLEERDVMLSKLKKIGIELEL